MSEPRSTTASALETASRLFGIGGVLKSTWPTLSDRERDRLLTELMARAATLRRSLGDGRGTGAGADGPSDE